MLASFARFVLLFIAMCAPAWAVINVNTASAPELETLPGIGTIKAEAIVEYRGQHGPFVQVEQLDNVPGIGPATLANIRPLVVLNQGEFPAVSPTEAAGNSPAAAAGSVVNINTALGSHLETLPGIGPSKAAAIIADREANGPFASCDSLQRVTGVGPATVSKLALICTVGE